MVKAVSNYFFELAMVLLEVNYVIALAKRNLIRIPNHAVSN